MFTSWRERFVVCLIAVKRQIQRCINSIQIVIVLCTVHLCDHFFSHLIVCRMRHSALVVEHSEFHQF